MTKITIEIDLSDDLTTNARNLSIEYATGYARGYAKSRLVKPGCVDVHEDYSLGVIAGTNDKVKITIDRTQD